MRPDHRVGADAAGAAARARIAAVHRARAERQLVVEAAGPVAAEHADTRPVPVVGARQREPHLPAGREIQLRLDLVAGAHDDRVAAGTVAVAAAAAVLLAVGVILRSLDHPSGVVAVHTPVWSKAHAGGGHPWPEPDDLAGWVSNDRGLLCGRDGRHTEEHDCEWDGPDQAQGRATAQRARRLPHFSPMGSRHEMPWRRNEAGAGNFQGA